MIEPTIGRIVHYVPRGRITVHLPAIVIKSLGKEIYTKLI